MFAAKTFRHRDMPVDRFYLATITPLAMVTRASGDVGTSRHVKLLNKELTSESELNSLD